MNGDVLFRDNADLRRDLERKRIVLLLKRPLCCCRLSAKHHVVQPYHMRIDVEPSL
jgi:hypothetical protein